MGSARRSMNFREWMAEQVKEGSERGEEEAEYGSEEDGSVASSGDSGGIRGGMAATAVKRTIRRRSKGGVGDMLSMSGGGRESISGSLLSPDDSRRRGAKAEVIYLTPQGSFVTQGGASRGVSGSLGLDISGEVMDDNESPMQRFRPTSIAAALERRDERGCGACKSCGGAPFWAPERLLNLPEIERVNEVNRFNRMKLQIADSREEVEAERRKRVEEIYGHEASLADSIRIPIVDQQCKLPEYNTPEAERQRAACRNDGVHSLNLEKNETPQSAEIGSQGDASTDKAQEVETTVDGTHEDQICEHRVHGAHSEAAQVTSDPEDVTRRPPALECEDMHRERNDMIGEPTTELSNHLRSRPTARSDESPQEPCDNVSEPPVVSIQPEVEASMADGGIQDEKRRGPHCLGSEHQTNEGQAHQGVREKAVVVHHDVIGGPDEFTIGTPALGSGPGGEGDAAASIKHHITDDESSILVEQATPISDKCVPLTDTRANLQGLKRVVGEGTEDVGVRSSSSEGRRDRVVLEEVAAERSLSKEVRFEKDQIGGLTQEAESAIRAKELVEDHPRTSPTISAQVGLDSDDGEDEGVDLSRHQGMTRSEASSPLADESVSEPEQQTDSTPKEFSKRVDCKGGVLKGDARGSSLQTNYLETFVDDNDEVLITSVAGTELTSDSRSTSEVGSQRDREDESVGLNDADNRSDDDSFNISDYDPEEAKFSRFLQDIEEKGLQAESPIEYSRGKELPHSVSLAGSEELDRFGADDDTVIDDGHESMHLSKTLHRASSCRRCSLLRKNLGELEMKLVSLTAELEWKENLDHSRQRSVGRDRSDSNTSGKPTKWSFMGLRSTTKSSSQAPQLRTNDKKKLRQEKEKLQVTSEYLLRQLTAIENRSTPISRLPTSSSPSTLG
eukprot:CAMPEP_0184678854 /NCGR_PEP_ID=MMETSP0312-20130426/1659_1 /TAXON_ID=31354 /ORGANISM="Compsopogon coeruleus, Strain SAG 36.94" /LENGTH=903 /DNA_ID=CAMNT_0027127915 /DNA_START=59 /DNA_END=2770 /DNA_ORIENTATION=-